MATRIGLGTVEIGIPYGIRRRPFPTDAQAIYLLLSAVEMGVTYFDTARGYGVAEKRIGESGITKLPGITVGTKCGQFLKKEPDLHFAQVRQRIRDEVEMSRQLLQRDMLDLVQLHIESADFRKFRPLFDIMNELQIKGKVRRIGVACRGVEIPLITLESLTLSTIQVAYNILDQRMHPRVMDKAQRNDKQVICRSVFLQGALSGAAQTLPHEFTQVREKAETARLIADEMAISLPELAIRFVGSNPTISTILVGTTSVVHLRSAVVAAAKPPLPLHALEQLYALAINDPALIDPANWPPLTPVLI